MIFDELQNASIYDRLGKDFPSAFDFLRRSDLASLKDGRYEIDGENVYAMVQSYPTRQPSECEWEAHRVYADIQYMTRGREKMGYAPISTMREKTPYDSARDFAFFEGDGQDVIVSPGSFAIFLPHDVHMPRLAVEGAEMISKVVVKVRMT